MLSAVLYGLPSRIGVRHYLRQKRSLSLGFTEIGTKVDLAAVIVSGTSSKIMVVVRFQPGRRGGMDGPL